MNLSISSKSFLGVTLAYAHIVDKSKRNAADVIHIENLTPTNDNVESVPAI